MIAQQIIKRVIIIGDTMFADPDLPQRMEGAGDSMTIGTTFFADLNDRTPPFAKEFDAGAAKTGIEGEISFGEDHQADLRGRGQRFAMDAARYEQRRITYRYITSRIFQ